MQQFSKKAVVFLFIKHIINNSFQGNTKYDVLEKPVQNEKKKIKMRPMYCNLKDDFPHK
jgi:hypothetical protein